MKICFVITNAPPLVGGLEKACLRIAQNFQRRGHKVQILARFTLGRHGLSGYFKDSEPARTFEFEGVEIQVLGLDWLSRLLLWPVFKLIWRRWTFPLARWLYVAAMRRRIFRECRDADVVHYFGNGSEMLGFAAVAAARRAGATFFVDPALHEGQWGDKWFDALLYKRADLMLAHTRHEAGVLERMGIPATKIRTIVHGVDFCESGDGGRFRGKHGITGPMVLFLGRKTREKGVGRLLEAWPMVAEKFPEATLVIAGPKSEALRPMADGEAASLPRTDVGERIADSNLPATSHSLPVTAPEARILNLDDLSEEEKQDALAACDLLCVPSEGESFGMVYFEAWAYKKPVVALDLPVLRETIGEARAGILVKNDSREVAAGIIRLLGDSNLRNELGALGKKMVLQHSWDNAVESYLPAYSQIAFCK